MSKRLLVLLIVKHEKQTVCDFCAKVITMLPKANMYGVAV